MSRHLFLLMLGLLTHPAAGAETIPEIYMQRCAVCHLPGIAGAPKVGEQAEWTRRAGRPLYEHQLVQLKVNEMHALTEALRSLVLRAGWEMDNHVRSPNPVLVMNYATDVILRVTRLNLEVHVSAGGAVDAMADKLVRDAIIWSHLAGDSTQRLKALRRMPK